MRTPYKRDYSGAKCAEPITGSIGWAKGDDRRKVVKLMQITYDSKTDLLYIRLGDRKQPVINRRLSEDIVLDIGEKDRIVGIEILDASERLNLGQLLPVQYEMVPA